MLASYFLLCDVPITAPIKVQNHLWERERGELPLCPYEIIIHVHYCLVALVKCL